MINKYLDSTSGRRYPKISLYLRNWLSVNLDEGMKFYVSYISIFVI